MSEMKYTPGPWHVGKDHEAGIGKGYFVGGGGCVRANMVGPAGNQEANARLIAAAPDLLEVAKMVGAWGHGLRHHTAHEAKMVKSARAAIAKAEGS